MILDCNSSTLSKIKEESIINQLKDKLQKDKSEENVIAEILRKLNDSELLITFKYLEALGYSDGENYVKQVYAKRRKSANCGSSFADETFQKVDATAMDNHPPYHSTSNLILLLKNPHI